MRAKLALPDSVKQKLGAPQLGKPAPTANPPPAKATEINISELKKGL